MLENIIKTKRQLNRCKRRMMNVLQERQLCLGKIESGFHFLGIAYPPLLPVNNTSTAPVDDGAIVDPNPHSLNTERGVFFIAK